MEAEFVLLGRRLLKAYARRDFIKVSQMATDYLAAAERYRDHTNYGNAIHQANTLLGLMELEQDHIDRAAEYLLNSARTPGSRQLKAFGPSMLLAQQLLERNQRRTVLRYLDECRSLWMLSFGSLWKWRRQILQGRTPNFGANLSYLTDYKSFG
ncbi:hypothetical protein LEM8419_02972 [Neolewinella maritima]|uniref:Tetratricopeptide repeat protein n=1 Tax=Neolewinella maritima TaxID=1383882 RepID=A0ABM9B4C9_9BACT|nr:hypothetical protein [Neolewinella maritima]CAH1002057.1 hypothetical protein LEM8419_02972 [Neolewinella maritima]